mmetsp:Transcript_91452/g.284391  ORF Transcript_91452/g.284391 Transcript_91452/m.284391 type:complete len:488 (+) Transcript_91452:768-2231(+)
MVAKALDFIHHALHQIVVACEKVNVRHAKDGRLLDLGKGALRVGVHRERRPDVEADKAVHLLEAIQQHSPRERRWLRAHQPGGHFRAGEVPLAAHHIDLLAAVFHDGADVLDREGSVAVEGDNMPSAEVVVDLVEGAVLRVAAEVLLARELHDVGQVQEAGPRAHGADDGDAGVPVLLVGRQVLHGVGPLLRRDLLDHGVEGDLAVQAVLARALAHHREQGVARGPGLVLHAVDLPGHLGPGLDVVHVVRPPLGLQLREPVRHLHPGVAAEVRVLLHAEAVRAPLGLQEVDHGLHAAEACPDDQERVLVLLPRPLHRLHAGDDHVARDLLARQLPQGARGRLAPEVDLVGVHLQHHAQELLDLLDLGGDLGAYGKGLPAALYVDRDRAVAGAVVAARGELVVVLPDVVGRLVAPGLAADLVPEAGGRELLGREEDAAVLHRRLGPLYGASPHRRHRHLARRLRASGSGRQGLLPAAAEAGRARPAAP